MKPHGSKCDYENERNHDLLRVFLKLIEAADVVCLPEIYKQVVNMPSSRFWVSEERAGIVISAMMKGRSLKGMRKNKREMFNEIYKRAMRIHKAYPELTPLELAIKVVRQPAPKFYLSPGSAEIYILKVKKQWYEERKRKLRHLF